MSVMGIPLARRKLACSLALAGAFWAAAPLGAQVSVTYVANEGFLIAAGELRVLVDALIDEGIDGYPRPPASMRPALEGALAPFDGVDVVLATHHHADHFGPRAVARHLAANPGAVFVSTPQAAARLAKEIGDDPGRRARIDSRIDAVFPAEGARTTISRPGIEIEVLNLHHGRERDPPVQNLGFLIEMGGLTMLHIGDTEVSLADIAPYRLAEREIDVAFLPIWFLTYDRWLPVVREGIRPRTIVAMHLAEADAPASWFGEDGSREKRVTATLEEFPEAILFAEPGETREFAPSEAAPVAASVPSPG